jgi:hypothetical protein
MRLGQGSFGGLRLFNIGSAGFADVFCEACQTEASLTNGSLVAISALVTAGMAPRLRKSRIVSRTGRIPGRRVMVSVNIAEIFPGP